MPEAERLTYDEFGHAFIDLVITPEQIVETINAQLVGEITIDEKVAAASVTGTAKPAACSATRAPIVGDALAEIQVAVPLSITLRVSILDILEEDYEVSATVALRLRVETWSPLTIIIHADTVMPDDVTLEISTSSWLKLAERLGGLEQQVKSTVCAEFNNRIIQSQGSRIFDVLERVRASLKSTQG